MRKAMKGHRAFGFVLLVVAFEQLDWLPFAQI